jgi:hypothetical protein
VAETGVGGAGDCERGVEFALFCCGGPRAQADFDGRGFFGVEAVADLLILRDMVSKGRKGDRCVKDNKTRPTRIRYNDNN